MLREFAVGLDGVDLSTVMPKVKDVTQTLNKLKNLMKVYNNIH